MIDRARGEMLDAIAWCLFGVVRHGQLCAVWGPPIHTPSPAEDDWDAIDMLDERGCWDPDPLHCRRLARLNCDDNLWGRLP